MSESRKSTPPLTVEEAMNPTAQEPSAEVRAWQDEQVRKGLAEADAGDFVTAEEHKATVRKFVRHG